MADNSDIEPTVSSDGFIFPKCRTKSLDFYGSYSEAVPTPDGGSITQNAGTESTAKASSLHSRRCELDDACVLRPPPDLEPAIRTDIAFGDGEGTIGYINEFGEIINMMRMLDFGPSGMIEARPNCVRWNYQDEVEHIVQASCPGIGLRLNDRSSVPDKDFRRVEYVHDRWPRVSYTKSGVEAEIQLAIVDKKFVQQIVLSNTWSTAVTVDLVFDLGITLDAPHRYDNGLRRPWKFDGGLLSSQNTCIALGGSPGGHAAFRASLFEGDGRPILLRPRTMKDVTNPEGEPNADTPVPTPVPEQEVKEETTSLFHMLPIELEAGKPRELTAIYQFDYEPWSRDQIYSMNIIRNEAENFRAAQRKKEDKFLEAYNKAKEEGDVVEATRIFKEGVPESSATSPEKAEPENPKDPTNSAGTKSLDDQKDPSLTDKPRVPFQNLGGESFYSHRLFGREWKSRYSYQQDLGYGGFYDLFYGERWRKDKEETRRLVAEKFEKLRAISKNGPACSYIDAHAYLSHNCPGKWIKNFRGKWSDFLFRRQLQHVLSVVPIAIPWVQDGDFAYFFGDGSLLSRSMSPATSLYQFRFLTCMHQLIRSEGDLVDSALKASLQSAIENTCKGHLEWCFEVAQKTKTGLWAGNYWPPGAALSAEDDHLHSAVNFLKLFDFWDKFAHKRDFVLRIMKKRLIPWLKGLQATKNKRSGLWESVRERVEIPWWDPEYRNDDHVSIPNYDLCDSVQIWQALRTLSIIMDELKTDGETRIDSSPDSDLQNIARELHANFEQLEFKNEFSPTTFGEKILERFSFEYTVHSSDEPYDKRAADALDVEPKGPKHTTKRLLAIKRSGKERPRWHWYAESMVLCQEFDLGFFDTGSSPARLPEWQDTVEAQRFQIEKFWKKPLRYTLSLILAMNANTSLDTSIDPQPMIERCQNVLFGCILANGQVAEEMNPRDKKPQERLRFGSQTVFGVPYYLLRTTYRDLLRPFPRSMKSLPDGSGGNKDYEEKTWKKDYKAISSRTKAGFYNSAKVQMANVVDLNGLCQPEWLFDDPWYFTKEDRLTGEASMATDGIAKGVRDAIKSELKSIEKLIGDEPKFPYAVFEQTILKYKFNQDKFFSDTFEERLGSMVDVIRTGKRQSRIDESLPDAWELLDKVWKKRTRDEVKKRLIYVYNCGPRFSLALYMSVPEKEKFSICTFLARHQRRDVFHREDTHKAINAWVTELHLGFYRIIPRQSTHAEDSDSDDDDEDEAPSRRTIFRSKPIACPGDKTKLIEKGAIGFRFDGDLYDRYWTCYAAVYLPDTENGRWFADVDSFSLTKPTGEGNKDREHSQRKILESRWFERATKIIEDETRKILHVVSGILGEDDNGLYSSNSYDTFRQNFETNKVTYFRYGELVKFFRHVLENLQSIRNVAEDWENRQNSREIQPRWTRDDEAAYADEIAIWRRKAKANMKCIEHLEQQIEAKVEHIKQLREWLLDDLQLKEARVSNRSADDVRIFTYATVIFLPLSFASSIFSMGGAPSHSTVVAFVTAAIIALVATVLLVLNAGTFMRAIASWKMTTFELPNEGFIMEHDESQWRGVARKFYDWFVQYPSKRVLIALEVIRDNRSKKSKPIGPSPDQSSAHNGTAGKLLLGLLFFPLHTFVTAIRFLALNLFDFAKLIFIVFPQYPAKRQKHKRQIKELKSAALQETLQAGAKEKEKQGKTPEKISNEKEKLKSDAEKSQEKWRQESLKHFMRQPRIKEISKHLAEGKSFKETLAAREEAVKKRKEELRERRKKYRVAEKEAEGLPGYDSDDEESQQDSMVHLLATRLAWPFRPRRRSSDEEAPKASG